MFIYSAKSSVTRLGNFWKFEVTKFLTKIAQIFGHYLGHFEKLWILRKSCFRYFFGDFWKSLATFYFNIWSHCRTTTTTIMIHSKRDRMNARKKIGDWAVVEWLLSNAEVRGSNPVIGKINIEHLFTVKCIEKTKNGKRSREWPIIKKIGSVWWSRVFLNRKVSGSNPHCLQLAFAVKMLSV